MRRRNHNDIDGRGGCPPRIGLNGLFLVPGGITGGLEPYFHHLATELTRLDQSTQYVVIANAANVLEFARLRRANLSCHVAQGPPLSAALVNLVRNATDRLLGRQPAADPGAAFLNLDLIHCFPGHIDSFSWNQTTILTVADVQHEYHPEFFDQAELDARRSLFRPSIERATHIIAISEFTRRTILERYGVSADKVSVTHLGVDSRFFEPISPGEIARVRRQYGLASDYCIYPANLWPHKNHPRLLDALRGIPAAERPHLVLTGAQTRLHTQIRAAVEDRGLAQQVSWLGFVDGRDLPALVAGARIMVFPSLFEGFGMPVLEAMAVGCPVACAEATAIPEVAGEAALFFDPTSTDSIATALLNLWSDTALQERLRGAGRAHARGRTWQKTALQTLRIYRKVLEQDAVAAEEATA